jgi:hypothetical protein
MNRLLKNVLAVILGLLFGSIINMMLVKLGSAVLPVPGVHPNDMEALKKILPTLAMKYFLFPFMAHALGTLFGAYLAYKIAADNKMNFAMVIGAFFLFGGITMIFMLPTPLWFTLCDLILAYLPMAWLGAMLAKGTSK